MEKLDTKVAIVSMPTLSASIPSFQLGLLKPTLEKHGIDVSTYCLYVYFARHVGYQLNEELSAVRLAMVGEWLWAEQAFGEFADDVEYVRTYQAVLHDILQPADVSLQELLEIRRNKTRSFIDWCLEKIDWSRYDLIGFSIVFQQMTASLAMAKALKEKYPGIPIIFGGATFEDDIAESIFDACPQVDYLLRGDGDKAFPEMIRRLDAGESMAGSPGLMWRDENGKVVDNGRAPNLDDMSQTPVPDFDEYFYAFKQCGFEKAKGVLEPMIPIETGRGCWWGEKNHCTFCGLNRAGMHFRSKPADQVLDLLQTLSRKYGRFHYNAIDNIMETDYIANLFEPLAEARADLSIHYEVRPHFSREQLGRMRQGGLVSVQPGIESLSTHVLKLMKKHGTGIKNLSFLKWCVYYGINNLYNILFGFAGETDEDYVLQNDLVKKIPHFQPPYGITNARPDRGSPMFHDPETHAVANLRPNSCYTHIYPTDRFELPKAAYFFEHEMTDGPDQEVYRQLVRTVVAWKERWVKRPRPFLQYRKSWNTVRIEDGRVDGKHRVFMYKDNYADLFEFCDEPRNMRAITKKFGEEPWIQEALDEMVAADVVLHMDKHYLNLCLPTNQYH